jgi:hypothetical protein
LLPQKEHHNLSNILLPALWFFLRVVTKLWEKLTTKTNNAISQATENRVDAPAPSEHIAPIMLTLNMSPVVIVQMPNGTQNPTPNLAVNAVANLHIHIAPASREG